MVLLFPVLLALAPGSLFDKSTESNGQGDGGIAAVTGITVDKSVEFSYEELAKATDNFSLANKIGEGGFGSVYYAELRGEVCCLISMRCKLVMACEFKFSFKSFRVSFMVGFVP